MARTKKQSTEAAVREIRRRTRRKFAPEEKVRIVLEGLWGTLERWTDRLRGDRAGSLGRPSRPMPSSPWIPSPFGAWNPLLIHRSNWPNSADGSQVLGAALVRWEDALDIETQKERESMKRGLAEKGAEDSRQEKRSNCLR